MHIAQPLDLYRPKLSLSCKISDVNPNCSYVKSTVCDWSKKKQSQTKLTNYKKIVTKTGYGYFNVSWHSNYIKIIIFCYLAKWSQSVVKNFQPPEKNCCCRV